MYASGRSPIAGQVMAAQPTTERAVGQRAINQWATLAVAGAVFASLGGAIAGASLISFRTSLTDARRTAAQTTFVDAFHTALLVCAAFAAFGVLTALVRGLGESDKTNIGSAEMTNKRVTNHGITVRSASGQYDDDEAQDGLASFRGFLKSEWTALWPAWVLFLVMVAVIVWDRLVQF